MSDGLFMVAHLLLVTTLAVVFLGAGSPSVADAGLFTQAFAPLSNPKAPAVAKASADSDGVPEVKLTVWEYTGTPFPIRADDC